MRAPIVKRSSVALLTTALVLAVGVAPAAAATRVVDDDKRQCRTAPFTTIQAAVDAAQPGDTVTVCPGLYPEQVEIGKNNDAFDDKSNLRVISQSHAGAVVRSLTPFRINGANADDVSGVEISRFRIEGLDASSGAGVALSHASRILIANNVISNVGVGIDQDDGVFGSMIRDNLITGYGGIGVKAAVFSGFSVGAEADVRFNTLIGGPGSTGVDIFSGTIGAGGPHIFGLVFGNTIANNGAAGVKLDFVDIDVKANKIFGNGIGLSLIRTQELLIENNSINSNDQQGILVLRPSGNNRFNANNARGNGGIDCEDRNAPGGSGTAGTFNTWTGNLGHESAPAGICKPTKP